MLFGNVLPPQRSAIVQQRPLMFLDIPCPHEAVWTQLNDKQRLAAVAVLARLIARSAMPQVPSQENHDD
jgi:hypothetical protein